MENNTIKEKICNALLSTKRVGVDRLIEKMEEIGFFEAPCSTNHHLCKVGGLAEHSLNVFEHGRMMAKSLYPDMAEYKEMLPSITLVTLLHDLGKTGYNGQPMYIENVLKNGKVSATKPFKTNTSLLPFPHEVLSWVIANEFIKLTDEEAWAILCHNGLYGPLRQIVMSHETPLYLILHDADMWASRVTEGKGDDCDEDDE